ncbi:hypothetical protein GCM10008013_09800 [Paenibacillus segetis]|uniref:Uncharacterized protein n=1 Tax=Paenibacillus segetis TaxID=1325360 RepID=A0ABQ1Y7M8_9BACL|nr:hypothetical protein GCM10008013_09800 [Paenibacillus segetis]
MIYQGFFAFFVSKASFFKSGCNSAINVGLVMFSQEIDRCYNVDVQYKNNEREWINETAQDELAVPFNDFTITYIFTSI